MLIKTIILISRSILRLIARINIINQEVVPETGGAIVVANHLGRLDAMLSVVLSHRSDLVLMIAEKYQKYAIWRWFARKLDAIWLNRFEVDYKALRQVHKRLRQGALLAIAPEGTRSEAESLALGKPGAAYLAAKTGLPVIPIGLTGTEDRLALHRLKRLRRLDITIRVGEPFVLPPMGRKNKDEYLQDQTEEIMCQIAALLPPKYRGVYAEHPRLLELLDGRGDSARVGSLVAEGA
jgi:1-acyl-sn-glycerol-3-phosphate acyltransferase